MAVTNAVKAQTLTSIDAATFTGAYQAVNPNGLTAPCFMLVMTNRSSSNVIVSYDGSTDNEFLGAEMTLILPFQTNSQPNNFNALMPEGTVIYVKGAAGVGNIYVSGYYQAQNN